MRRAHDDAKDMMDRGPSVTCQTKGKRFSACTKIFWA